MTEFRCTRNALYQHPCLGSDITGRQGYYVFASCEDEALKIMISRFPLEAKAGFTADKK